MVNIGDVAKRAGVSTATVSHVLNGTRFVSSEVSERVKLAMAEVGYRPNRLARSLRQGHSQTIGLMLPDSSNPFFAELARGIETAAYAHGYSVIICNTDGDLEKESSYLNLLVEQQVDGIILDPEDRDIERLVTKLPKDYPVVGVDRDFQKNFFEVVVTDNYTGALMATNHLIGLGHKCIACVTGDLQMMSGVNRLKGFQHAMSDAGLQVPKKYIYQGNWNPKSGYAAGMKLLRPSNRPTAVFTCNDMMAIGLIRSAFELGLRVPEDLSVIGFDDLELDKYLFPPLTSISHQKAKIGHKAVEVLLKRIAGQSHTATCYLIPALLMVRHSTAPYLPLKKVVSGPSSSGQPDEQNVIFTDANYPQLVKS